MILNLPCSNADEGIGVEWYRGGVRTSALENPLWLCALPIDAPPEVTVTGICPLPYQKNPIAAFRTLKIPRWHSHGFGPTIGYNSHRHEDGLMNRIFFMVALCVGVLASSRDLYAQSQKAFPANV